MGGKRSWRRGRGGGGRGGGERERGRGGNDASTQQVERPSLVSEGREPPARQSQQQHYNLGRGDQSATAKQPQEPPTDYLSGSDQTECRSNTNNSRRAGSKPVTRAEQKRTAAATISRRQDPPDENRSIAASSHSSQNRVNKNNQDGRNRRKSNDHFNHQYHDNVERDSPQLDEEEQLQYEQFEDQHYSQHFLN